MAQALQRQTIQALRDLHAREAMRLGWYRTTGGPSDYLQQMRERKAQHLAYLNRLLRERDRKPGWYARAFYILGHLLGLLASFLPQKTGRQIERTLEYWILIRYRRYFKTLRLDHNMRSMIEAMQLRKLPHAEPGADVLQTLERHIAAEEQWLQPQDAR